MRRRRLIARRELLGHTQESLAAELGVDLSTVGRWERGAQGLTPGMRPRLAKALKVSATDLAALFASDEESEAPGDVVRRSQEQWLRVRKAPGARGRELAELAAWLYPAGQRAPGGHVLTGPGWLLTQPVELEQVRLHFTDQTPPVPELPSTAGLLPLNDRGEPYTDYSRAVRDLVRPRLLENRVSYRLLGLRAVEGTLELEFGTTTFFEVFHVKSCLAHEFKAAYLAAQGSVPGWDALPLRQAIGDPFDPRRLLMSPGIVTLTIRRGTGGRHRFVLHERDGDSVADGGSLCSLMPAGEFQPSSVQAVDVRNDFSLWRNIMREYSEEFLANPEHDGNGARAIDYASEEPFASFGKARAAGRLRMWHYGLVSDPLTLGPSQRTVAVVDDTEFDRLFGAMTRVNDEGRVVGESGRADMPFTDEAITRLEPRLSPGSLSLLHMAWRDRHLLLG